MKRLLLPICIVALVALLFSALGDKSQQGEDVPRFTSVSEAAFSMRSSGAEDATSRLVGNYLGENGEKLSFNGTGDVRRISQNFSSVEGDYTLLQSSDGAAILQMDYPGASQLYSFHIVSPEGQFSLTDQDGSTETFTPVP